MEVGDKVKIKTIEQMLKNPEVERTDGWKLNSDGWRLDNRNLVSHYFDIEKMSRFIEKVGVISKVLKTHYKIDFYGKENHFGWNEWMFEKYETNKQLELF